MVRVIAHRGASATHPENTLEAFRAAADQGAHGVELDVRLTADGVLVVHHDAHLASGEAVCDVAVDDLPDAVPTLAEALEACADLWLNVEIKNSPGEPDYDADQGQAVAVAGLVRAFDAASRVLVSSFDMAALDRIRAVDADIPLAWLVWAQADPVSLVDRAAGRGLAAIHPHELLADRSFVGRCRAAGLAVNVWTVDSMTRVDELARIGVDGIITNHPAEVVARLGRTAR